MANMSYCRFENTSHDLADCEEHMDVDPETLSEHEQRARKRIIESAVRIALEYGSEVGQEVTEIE